MWIICFDVRNVHIYAQSNFFFIITSPSRLVACLLRQILICNYVEPRQIPIYLSNFRCINNGGHDIDTEIIESAMDKSTQKISH